MSLLPGLTSPDLNALAEELLTAPDTTEAAQPAGGKNGRSEVAERDALRSELVFTRWGEVDPEAALAFARAHPRASRDHQAAIHAGWAAVDFPAAVSSARASFLLNGIDALLDQLPVGEAMPLAQRYRRDHRPFLLRLLDRWHAEDRPAALAWAQAHGFSSWAEKVQADGPNDPNREVVHQLEALVKDNTRLANLAERVGEFEQADSWGANEWIRDHHEEIPLSPVPTEALDTLATLPEGRLRDALTSRVAARWIAEDKTGALAWLRTTFPDRTTDPGDAAGSSLLQPPDSLADEDAGNPQASVRRHQFDAANALLHALEASGDIATLMQETGRLGEPAWIESVVDQRTFHDPQETIAWLTGLDPGGSRFAKAWIDAARTWLREQPDQASEWVAQLPPGALRDTTIEVVADHLCRPGEIRDFPAAAEWAVQIGEPKARSDSLEKLLRTWSDTRLPEAQQALENLAPHLAEDTLLSLRKWFKAKEEGPP